VGMSEGADIMKGKEESRRTQEGRVYGGTGLQGVVGLDLCVFLLSQEK